MLTLSCRTRNTLHDGAAEMRATELLLGFDDPLLRHLCPRAGADPGRELTALGAEAVEPGRGGVRFQGDQALLYRANLWLRTAVRVLRPILEAEVHSPDELYDAVRTIDWAST